MGSYLHWIILARGGSAESCAYRPYRLGEVEEREKREHVRKARERTLQAAEMGWADPVAVGDGLRDIVPEYNPAVGVPCA